MIGTLIQAGLGAAQMVGGLFMKNPDLPEYQIASEAKSNLEEAYQRRNLGLASGTMDYLTRQGERAGASAIASSASRKGGLGLIATVAQQRADQASNIAMMDEQRRQENLNRVYTARSQMISEKDKQFDVKYRNIQDQRLRRAEMIGAGMQNIAGAVGTAEMADSLTGSNTFGDIAKIFKGRGKSVANAANTAGVVNMGLIGKGLSLGSTSRIGKTYNPSTGRYE